MKDLIINFIIWLVEVIVGAAVIIVIWTVISYLLSLFLLHFNWHSLQIEIALLLSITYQCIMLALITLNIFNRI